MKPATTTASILSPVTWPMNAFNVADDIKNASHSLDSIGQALYRTGNAVLGKELLELARQLSTANLAIRDIICAKISGDLRQSRQMTGALFNAVIAGVVMERKAAT